MAPNKTSRHSTFAAGSTLKIAATSEVRITNGANVCQIVKRKTDPGIDLLSAGTMIDTAIDVDNTIVTATIIKNAVMRFSANRSIGGPTGSTSQARLMTRCNSTNALVPENR